MTKYSVTNYITHGRFPEVGEKQKTERKREKKKKRRDRTMAITMAKLRMAHASTHGARKYAWCTQAAWAYFSFFSVHCFSPPLGGPRKLIFIGLF